MQAVPSLFLIAIFFTLVVGDLSMRRDAVCTSLIVISLMVMVVIAPVGAHSPSNLVLSYDPAAGELQATFTHQVDNPAVHYVHRVEVEVEGGPDLLQQEYTSQPALDTFTYTYPVQVPPGTLLRVKGECSIGGEIRRELMVVAAPTDTPTIPPAGTTPSVPVTGTTPPQTVSPTQSPGFGLLTAALALGAAGMLILRK
jgi:hypothetical protein